MKVGKVKDKLGKRDLLCVDYWGLVTSFLFASSDTERKVPSRTWSYSTGLKRQQIYRGKLFFNPTATKGVYIEKKFPRNNKITSGQMTKTISTHLILTFVSWSSRKPNWFHFLSWLRFLGWESTNTIDQSLRSIWVGGANPSASSALDWRHGRTYSNFAAKPSQLDQGF